MRANVSRNVLIRPITDGLLRLSVGIEGVEDLEKDILEALNEA